MLRLNDEAIAFSARWVAFFDGNCDNRGHFINLVNGLEAASFLDAPIARFFLGFIQV